MGPDISSWLLSWAVGLGTAVLLVVVLVHLLLSTCPDLTVLASGAPLPPYREEGVGGPLLTSKAPLRDSSGEITAVVTTSLPLGPEPER